MTLFLLAMSLLALLAAGFLAAPLLRPRAASARAPLVALAAIVVVIGISALIYALLGSRGWLRVQADQGSSNIATLARHLERDPQDLSGWLQIGSAYSQIGQYSLALRANERANRLSNGGNAAALSGMGEAMLLSGDAAQGAQAAEFFERALQLDAHAPKALFYSAVIAYRAGDFQKARARFSSMLALNPPQAVRVALQKQIDQIDEQLHPKIDEASAIRLHVSLAPGLAAKVPAQASLFVFVASTDGGPPLAVKRSAVELPADVELSAADAMIAGRAVHAGQKVSVVARISASGSPLAQSGDLYGQIDYIAGKSGPKAILIDKLSP